MGILAKKNCVNSCEQHKNIANIRIFPSMQACFEFAQSIKSVHLKFNLFKVGFMGHGRTSLILYTALPFHIIVQINLRKEKRLVKLRPSPQ